jgi:hypothetical protein
MVGSLGFDLSLVPLFKSVTDISVTDIVTRLEEDVKRGIEK